MCSPYLHIPIKANDKNDGKKEKENNIRCHNQSVIHLIDRSTVFGLSGFVNQQQHVEKLKIERVNASPSTRSSCAYFYSIYLHVITTTTTNSLRFNVQISIGKLYEEVRLEPQYRDAFAKQLGLPAGAWNQWNMLVNRVPCECHNGVCGCCTGMFIPAWRSVGCMNITYHPDDFAFEFKMIMNNAVLYENRLTGRNPPPVCVRPPRFSFVQVCAEFHDLYFIGRNMHVCMDMTASFQDYEIFNR